MRLLLDTHVLLWMFGAGGDVTGTPSAAQRAAVEDPGSTVLVSVAAFWEIAINVRRGKMRLSVERLAQRTEEAALARLPILDAHLRALASLPFYPDHRDPFDHLLIAQAVAEDLVFVTADRHAPRYPVRLLG